jgi:glycosyltransferase involved in cell wall biosynthesis
LSVFQRLWFLLPEPLRSVLREVRAWRHIGRWWQIWRTDLSDRAGARVFYGHGHIPRADEPTFGGIVKFQRIQDVFPNDPLHFNVLYMVSSRMADDWRQLLWLARQRRARVVWNQNGVAYAGWYGPGWQAVNRPIARMLHAADFVFYQSRFCKLSADRFLGERRGRGEILYNAVDTDVFTPAAADPDRSRLVILLGGTQYQRYRLEAALQTVAILRRRDCAVHLLVSGALNWPPDHGDDPQRAAHRLVTDLGLTSCVTFLGPYAQHDAPAILRRAHLLLHTKYNDPCPGVVVEAMACGLPVVYSRSGGVPELVGEDAGVGIPTALDWEHDQPPPADALADAVLQVAAHRADFAAAARRRAVERFDLRPWVQRHREVFEELLA